MEQARPVTYPGIQKDRYIITETGQVMDGLNKVLHPFNNTYGYYQVRMKNSNGGVSVPLVSRLVAYEFCKNPDLNLTVDHVNCNKHDNDYRNLEWVTNKENQKRAYNNHLHGYKSYKTSSQISNLARILQDEPKCNYEYACEKAGILDLNQNQAKGLCDDIIARKYWIEETKDFDFSARVHPKQISDEYKDSLRKLKNMHLSTNEIYEKIENKSWEDLTRKERDSFRHIVKRACKKSI